MEDGGTDSLVISDRPAKKVKHAPAQIEDEVGGDDGMELVEPEVPQEEVGIDPVPVDDGVHGNAHEGSDDDVGGDDGQHDAPSDPPAPPPVAPVAG
eukprot:11534-Pyramimonas_sp.AAC.1